MAYENFPAETRYLQLPTGDIPPSTYPLTIAAWAYDTQTTNTSQRTLVSFGRSTSDVPSIRIFRPDGQRAFVLSVRDDSNVGESTASVSYGSANVWAHAGGVLDETSRAVWVNGTPSATATATITQPTLDRFAMLTFYRINPNTFTIGRVAEVAVWSAYLGDDEMISLSKGFKPHRIRPQSLRFYAPLVRDLNDVRGALTITNVNNASVADHARVY